MKDKFALTDLGKFVYDFLPIYKLFKILNIFSNCSKGGMGLRAWSKITYHFLMYRKIASTLDFKVQASLFAVFRLER